MTKIRFNLPSISFDLDANPHVFYVLCFLMACLGVVMLIMGLADAMRRHFPPGESRRYDLTVSFIGLMMLGFACVSAYAIYQNI